MRSYCLCEKSVFACLVVEFSSGPGPSAEEAASFLSRCLFFGTIMVQKIQLTSESRAPGPACISDRNAISRSGDRSVSESYHGTSTVPSCHCVPQWKNFLVFSGGSERELRLIVTKVTKCANQMARDSVLECDKVFNDSPNHWKQESKTKQFKYSGSVAGVSFPGKEPRKNGEEHTLD